MRIIYIDLSSDNYLQQPKIFGGYEGEHNETFLQVKLPRRMIETQCSGYRFDFQTSEGEKISSPLIPISKLDNDVISFPLIEQLTCNSELFFDVVAIVLDEDIISSIGKTNGVTLYFNNSPKGKNIAIDINGYKDEFLDMVDSRISELTLGKKTLEGGEIFNDYETNKALNDFSKASGYNNIASCKGFEVVGVKINNPNEGLYGVHIKGNNNAAAGIATFVRIPAANITAGKTYTANITVYGKPLKGTDSELLIRAGAANNSTILARTGSGDNKGTITTPYANTIAWTVDVTPVTATDLYIGIRLNTANTQNADFCIGNVELIDENGNNVAPELAANTVVYNAYGATNAISKWELDKLAPYLTVQETVEISDLYGTKILELLVNGDATSLSQFTNGNEISFQWDNTFDLACNIVAVEYIENDETIQNQTKVVVDNIPIDFSVDMSTSGYLWVPRYPEIGIEKLGTAASVEGYENKAVQITSHAEGYQTLAAGQYSHTEGRETVAAHASHAEGEGTKATGRRSHAEGKKTTASGDGSHSEGVNTIASGQYSHAEGYQTTASGMHGHAEGKYAKATGESSHAEGHDVMATAKASHAEGYRTTASGEFSHAEGYHTKANGIASHVGGTNTIAGYENQTVIGKFNDNKADTLFEVGNGTSTEDRSNAFEVYKDGHIEIQTVGETDNSVATKKYVDDATKKYVDEQNNQIKTDIVLTDKVTNINYRLYISNGKLQIEVAE